MTRARTVAEITGWAVVAVAGHVVGIPATDLHAFPRAVTDPLTGEPDPRALLILAIGHARVALLVGRGPGGGRAGELRGDVQSQPVVGIAGLLHRLFRTHVRFVSGVP